MRRWLIGGLMLTLMGLMSSPAFAQKGRGSSAMQAARHGWLSDYRQAREVARKTGKPILLEFRCIP